MSNGFLINTPSHKRWMLPDGIHAYNGIIYGNDIRMSVINTHSGETREFMALKLDNPQWKDLSFGFQELARKKYRKPLRHKSSEVLRMAGL